MATLDALCLKLTQWDELVLSQVPLCGEEIGLWELTRCVAWAKRRGRGSSPAENELRDVAMTLQRLVALGHVCGRGCWWRRI
jgi:hypothetical protein